MGNAVPVKDLLLLLCPDAVVLVEKVQKGALGLLERGIGSRLEISQIREDAFLKLLGVLYWTAKGLEAERETSYDIGAGDVEKVVPENAGDVLARWEKKAANVLVGLPVNWRRNKKVFNCRLCQCLWRDRCADPGSPLTVINLLQSYLSIVWESLLGF